MHKFKKLRDFSLAVIGKVEMIWDNGNVDSGNRTLRIGSSIVAVLSIVARSVTLDIIEGFKIYIFIHR